MARKLPLKAIPLILALAPFQAAADTDAALLGPYEIASAFDFRPIGELYERYDYGSIGVFLQFHTSLDEGYVPFDGETWEIKIRNEESDQVLVTTTLTYDAEQDCVVASTGEVAFCGLYPEPDPKTIVQPVSYTTICMDEKRHSIEATLSGESADGSPYEFLASRFRPALANVEMPESITPELPGDNFTSQKPLPPEDPGEAEINFTVVDDIGCGERLENTNIEITNEAVPVRGAHDTHLDPGAHGSGEYIPQKSSDVVTDDEPHRIEGEVDDNAEYITRYRAGVHGIGERLNITMIRPARDLEPKEIDNTEEQELDIKVPGLQPLQATGDNEFVSGFKGGCDHGGAENQLYVTSEAASEFNKLNALYNQLTGNHLSFNDASLPFGGFFDNDVDKNSREAGCHISHRRGIDIDLNGKADAQGQPMRRPDEGNNTQTTVLDLLTEKAEDQLGVEKVIKDNIHYRYVE